MNGRRDSTPGEEYFAAAFEFAPIGMALLDLQSRAVRVNHALCDMLGYTAQEQAGLGNEQVAHPDDVEEDFRMRALMLAGAFPSYQRDKRYIHRSGRLVWTHISCSLVHDDRGQPANFLLQVLDITDRQHAQARLRESEERFRDTFEQAALGIVHIGIDGRMQRVNGSFCRMLGATREELVGRPAPDVTADRGEGTREQVRALLAGEIPSYSVRRLLVRKSGDVFAVRASVTLVRPASGEPYVISIIEDLTQHELDQERIREQAEQLARANNELEARIRERTAALEESNRQLRAFAYSLAHDLRAPLASTDGFARQLEILLGEQLDERGRHYLQRIRAGAQSMSDLTDALLSLANLSQEPLQHGPVDLSAIARTWVAHARERDGTRRVQVEIADTPRVHGDARLLAALLGNLLDNAWKFSSRVEDARIAFGAQPGPDGVEFFVTDNGAGFDAQYAGKLFHPFQRLHAAHEFRGTGMGLAIAQMIAQRHGGRVWAQARVGEGATFRFTLAG